MVLASHVPPTKAVIGGAQRLLVAAFAASTRPTYADASRTVVTGLDPAPDWFALGGLRLPDGSTWNQPAVAGPVASWDQSATIPFAGLSGAQRAALLALCPVGARVWALVQDAKGNWWLPGQTRGLRASVNSAGGTPGDAQGDTLTLSGNEPTLARQFDAATASALYAAAYAAYLDSLDPGEDPGDGGGDA